MRRVMERNIRIRSENLLNLINKIILNHLVMLFPKISKKSPSKPLLFVLKFEIHNHQSKNSCNCIRNNHSKTTEQNSVKKPQRNPSKEYQKHTQ